MKDNIFKAILIVLGGILLGYVIGEGIKDMVLAGEPDKPAVGRMLALSLSTADTVGMGVTKQILHRVATGKMTEEKAEYYLIGVRNLYNKVLTNDFNMRLLDAGEDSSDTN